MLDTLQQYLYVAQRQALQQSHFHYFGNVQQAYSNEESKLCNDHTYKDKIWLDIIICEQTIIIGRSDLVV